MEFNELYLIYEWDAIYSNYISYFSGRRDSIKFINVDTKTIQKAQKIRYIITINSIPFIN
jgi:hypothetical protein